jgi:hypothetical protein
VGDSSRESKELPAGARTEIARAVHADWTGRASRMSDEDGRRSAGLSAGGALRCGRFLPPENADIRVIFAESAEEEE